MVKMVSPISGLSLLSWIHRISQLVLGILVCSQHRGCGWAGGGLSGRGYTWRRVLAVAARTTFDRDRNLEALPGDCDSSWSLRWCDWAGGGLSGRGHTWGRVLAVAATDDVRVWHVAAGLGRLTTDFG